MMRSFLLLTLLFASFADAGTAKKTCKEQLIAAAASGSFIQASAATEAIQKPTEKEVQAFLKFILENFRLPTEKEQRELGITPVALKQIFGSWGEVWAEIPAIYGKKGAPDVNAAAQYSAERIAAIQDSIFSAEQIESILGAFYKKLGEWAKIKNRYPPTLNEFAEFLGISTQKNERDGFIRIFSKRFGLFRDYYEGFKGNAGMWKDLASILNQYPDTMAFNDEIAAQLIADVSKSQSLVVAGYISGIPVQTGIIDAMMTFQNFTSRAEGSAMPLVTFPAYGLSSGLPDVFSAPDQHRFVCPQTLFLQGGFGQSLSVNRIPLPNRALVPQTGVVKVTDPGGLSVLVHPHSLFVPVASSTKYPSGIITTGAINALGMNFASRAIGARISALQNEMQRIAAMRLEKIAGLPEDLRYKLETRYRPREMPFNEESFTITNEKGEPIEYPPGFSDLNKHYGIDGKVRDLPILAVVFGDSHSPNYDPAFYENFYRQFIHPETALKRTDGKPVDILSFVFNDHFDLSFFGRHIEGDFSANASLIRQPLERDYDLQMKYGLTMQKDLLYQMQRTRGYVPYIVDMYSNHGYDRVMRLLRTGKYLENHWNAAALTRMKNYANEGKNPFEEYLRKDIGVSYNEHFKILGPNDRFSVSNLNISHGHMGGVFGKPVSPLNRRAAVGAEANGHTHVAGWYDQVFNAGHSALPFDYAKGWFNSGFQAIAIRTPIHTQILFYMGGTFYGPQTHGDPGLEFRQGFPNVSPLPVLAQTLPGVASEIEQYFKSDERRASSPGRRKRR